MLVGLVFLCGIANFAMHKAVLESGHPMLHSMLRAFYRGQFPISMALEFAVLSVALLLASHNSGFAVSAYAIYTAFNALAAWAIVKGRI